MLLQTKLFRPTLRPALITRPHLIAQMNGILGTGKLDFSARLTLICAPAGFGKTTLISAWLSQLKDQGGLFLEPFVAWLSLDENDNDPVRFLTYLIAALQTAVPDAGLLAGSLLQSSQSAAFETILTFLINDLSKINQPAVLILDDYHLITTPAVHQALAYFLEYLPAKLHLLISTRSNPPLPLSRLRARSQLVELRARDLRFNQDETGRFFHQVMGLNLQEVEVAALEQLTEGWIAGLQLAALSLQGRDDRASFIATFSGSHRFILDYLTDEVLEQRPEGTRNFLLETSILDRLCGPLCEAVTGCPGGQATLEQLEQANLFLNSVDEERRWYRYHHLFAEVLYRRLLQEQPGRLAELHQRASAWHEQNGLIAAAIRHAFAARDYDQAIRLIEQIGPSWLEAGNIHTLREWLKALPEELIQSHPHLKLIDAYMLTFSGDPAGFHARLEEIEKDLRTDQRLPDAERNDLLGEIAALQARKAFDRNEGLDAGALRAILATISAGNTRVQGILSLAIGQAERMIGNFPEAARFYNQAAQLARKRGDPLQTVYILGTVADLQETQGLLRQAAQTYRETMQFATAANGRILPHAATACIGLGRLYYEWNDLVEAERYLRLGLELGKQSGIEAVELYCTLPLALVMEKQGDGQAADALIQQAGRIARKWNLAKITGLVLAYKARLGLMQGQGLSGVNRAPSDMDGDGNTGADKMLLLYYMPARVLMAQGDPAGALTFLNPLLFPAEKNGYLRQQIEILILQALAYQLLGQMAEAIAKLEQAVDRAEPEGYIQIFVEEGEQLRQLLHVYRSQLASPGELNGEDKSRRLWSYSVKLLAAFSAAHVITLAPAMPYWDPLSERELEVLHLVAAGASNREIADTLFLAVPTVKKHISNILSKLNVTNRTQAVSKARTLGLL